MTTSAARVAANRQNALKSTGPKTVAGKAASRLNAFQHGMAGQGDLLQPGEDQALVAHRALAFAREFGATGETGYLLARRAAVLSVRMENLAAGEMLTVAAADAAARADFDTDRSEAIDELLAAAANPDGDPAPMLTELAACPDGLARLLVAWNDLRGRLGSVEPGAAEQAIRWLGRTGAASAGHELTDLIQRVDVETRRLQTLARTMGPIARQLEQARTEAGLLAQFDPSPEATLARRYEAAAERGMYRAMRAITEINHQGGRSEGDAGLTAALHAATQHLTPAPRPPDPPRLIPPVDSPRPAPLPPVATSETTLASFRAGVATPTGSGPVAPLPPPVLDPASPEARRRRPDLRKLDRKHIRTRH